ncbi:MAG: hypothetical protein FWD63_08975, partial [Propionibacteriaceae bacterium]|nr:hypothetical protein [Propionibacteriaceae bacterium]
MSDPTISPTPMPDVPGQAPAPWQMAPNAPMAGAPIPGQPWAGMPQGQPVAPGPMPAAYSANAPRADIQEKAAWSISGLLALVVDLALWVGGVILIAMNASSASSGYGGGGGVLIGIILCIIAFLLLTSIKIVSPGDTIVLTFFGNYIGTIRHTGINMTVPFTSPRHVSVKVRNFETHEL